MFVGAGKTWEDVERRASDCCRSSKLRTSTGAVEGIPDLLPLCIRARSLYALLRVGIVNAYIRVNSTTCVFLLQSPCVFPERHRSSHNGARSPHRKRVAIKRHEFQANHPVESTTIRIESRSSVQRRSGSPSPLNPQSVIPTRILSAFMALPGMLSQTFNCACLLEAV